MSKSATATHTVLCLLAIVICLGSHHYLQAELFVPSNPISTPTDAPPPEKSTYALALQDWDTLTARLHTAKSPSSSEIHAFILAVIGVQPDEATVCSASFVELRGSDEEALVASIDVSGRRLCNQIEVIHKNADSITFQELNAFGIIDIDVESIIGEPGKGGRSALVVPTALSPYEGANSCMATWSKIYEFQAGALVDRSATFKEFYKAQLKSVQKEIPRARRDDAENHRDQAVCLQMEADKLERFLGISPDAGEEEALNWIDSKNEYLRRKGFAVLADIRDKKSVAVLENYAKGSDPELAAEAKFALTKMKK